MEPNRTDGKAFVIGILESELFTVQDQQSGICVKYRRTVFTVHSYLVWKEEGEKTNLLVWAPFMFYFIVVSSFTIKFPIKEIKIAYLECVNTLYICINELKNVMVTVYEKTKTTLPAVMFPIYMDGCIQSCIYIFLFQSPGSFPTAYLGLIIPEQEYYTVTHCKMPCACFLSSCNMYASDCN